MFLSHVITWLRKMWSPKPFIYFYPSPPSQKKLRVLHRNTNEFLNATTADVVTIYFILSDLNKQEQTGNFKNFFQRLQKQWAHSFEISKKQFIFFDKTQALNYSQFLCCSNVVLQVQVPSCAVMGAHRMISLKPGAVRLENAAGCYHFLKGEWYFHENPLIISLEKSVIA